MHDLVFLAPNTREPFTTSDVIAAFAGIQHHTVTRLIQQHEADFKEFGLLRFQIDAVKREGARGTKYTKHYQLNEEQATLLMTYLKNTAQVRAFKKELVRQFYAMRTELYAEEISLVAEVENKIGVLIGIGMGYQEIKAKLTRRIM